MSRKQQIFQDTILGILLYSVVLGFFNDYTNILQTTSYSTTFALAVVMQLLTYATFRFKDIMVQKLTFNKGLMIFGVWFVMFSSKFVFLAAISMIFNEDVHVSGFVGLMSIIVMLTLVQKCIDIVNTRLA